MRLRIRSLSCLSLLIVLLSPMWVTSAAATDERCFPETRQCISGRFRAYWEQNGGLPVFGFPITSAQDHVNGENGQSYLTQWFERNRFEFHPENVAPYDVLLGRLGDDRLRLQGVDWQTRPHPSGPQEGCVWFAQTAHMVCDQDSGFGFKSYWQRHGLQDPRLDAYGRSLALFGLPLTEATVEMSPTNGQPYLTQWFERARLEWHPDERDEYKVLLGLLGNEVQSAQSPSPGSTPSPAPNSTAQLLTSSAIGDPVATGRSLLWIDGHTAGQSMYRYDLDMQTTTLVTERATTKRSLASDGQTIAWIEDGPHGANSIQGIPLAGHNVFTIIDATEQRTINHIALADGALYYYDATEGHQGIFARTIATKQERLMATGSNDFVVGDGILLWNSEHIQNGIGPGQETLHILKLDGSMGDTVIAQDHAEGRFFAVAGDTVIWNYPGRPVMRYTISSQALQTLGEGGAYYPVATSAAVFWTGVATTTSTGATVWPVVRYTLGTGTYTTVATIEAQSLIRVRAVVGQNIVAYAQSNQDGIALYILPVS